MGVGELGAKFIARLELSVLRKDENTGMTNDFRRRRIYFRV